MNYHDRDIKDLKPFVESGITSSKGKVIYTKEDVKDLIMEYNNYKLNAIAQTSKYERGAKETKALVEELSKDYLITYDERTKSYTLRR